MASCAFSPTLPRGLASILVGLLALLQAEPAAQAQQPLRIGTSGNLGLSSSKEQAKSAMTSLKQFIKDETGLDNEIVKQKDWRELAEKMTKKELSLGVFQGYEYAWVQGDHASLKPLVLAVKGTRYQVAYVVTRKDDPASDFAGLKGYPLALPVASRGFPEFFVQRQSQAQGKPMDKFFAKMTTPDNVEDALDDVIDRNVQAAVTDQAGLEAYKRRKPGRFRQLKEVTQSQPVPLAVIAYTEGALEQATLDRFRNGLVQAGQKERGQTLLTLFRLTGFERIPADFDKVLTEARKAYPPEERDK